MIYLIFDFELRGEGGGILTITLGASQDDGKSAFGVRGVASQTEGPERMEDRRIVKGDGESAHGI